MSRSAQGKDRQRTLAYCDLLSGGQVVTDLVSRRVAQGNYFTFSALSTLTAFATQNFGIQLSTTAGPSHVYIRVRAGYAGLSSVLFTLHEGATFTGGAATQGHCHNRNYTTSPPSGIAPDIGSQPGYTGFVYTAPTVSAAGTTIFSHVNPILAQVDSGWWQLVSPSGTRQYLLRLFNLQNASISGAVAVDYYFGVASSNVS